MEPDLICGPFGPKKTNDNENADAILATCWHRTLAAFVLGWRPERATALGFHIIPWEEILLRLCSNIFCVLGPVIVQ